MSGRGWPLLHEAVAAMSAPFGRVQAEGLEEDLKAAYGVNHAIAVSSGTAALHSALIGFGAGPGAEALVPAFTVVMTVAAGAAAFRTHWQTGTPTHPPGHRLGHNLRLAEPLAALARHSVATRDAALTRRREQTDLLSALVGDLPGLAPIPAAPREHPNGYAALWWIERPQPRELCQRLAAAGVVNAIGTFGLRAAHTHPACQTLDPAVCPRAEALIDSLLSVPVMSADDDERIGEIAKLIRTELAAWH